MMQKLVVMYHSVDGAEPAAEAVSRAIRAMRDELTANAPAHLPGGTTKEEDNMITADGAKVTEGMVVWPKHEMPDDEGATVVFGLRDNVTGEVLIHGDTCDITKCYSERQEANAPAHLPGGTSKEE